MLYRSNAFGCFVAAASVMASIHSTICAEAPQCSIEAEAPAAPNSCRSDPADDPFRQTGVLSEQILDSADGDDVEARATARWHLLSYPTGRIPSQAWTVARRSIEANVPIGHPWPNSQVGLTRGLDAVVNPLLGAWTLMGPRPLDQSTQQSNNRYGYVAGRFSAVAVDPRTVGTPGAIVAYAGAAGGGLWRSSNCCGASTNWVPLWDNERIGPQSVGAVELDPNNPDVIYVGTGDFDAVWEIADGIMKSVDKGQTWSVIASDVFTSYAPGTPLWDNQNIGVIKVDPRNSSTVLAGTRFDLYISHDAGTSWTRCPFGANPTDPTSASNPVNAVNRISGLILDATTNPTTAYVGVGDARPATPFPRNGNNGVYKGTITSSACPVLSLITSGSNGWPAGTGNGTNGATTVGRIRLASSRGNTSGNLVIYAQVADSSDNSVLGTWVTVNQGVSWTKLSGGSKTNYVDCVGSPTGGEVQDWYNLWLQADPSDDKRLYIGRADIYRAAIDPFYSSMSIEDIGFVYASSCPGSNTIHPDMHHMAWVSGTGGSSRFLVASDGGVYSATGVVGGFTNLNSSVPALELWAGQMSADFASASTQYLWTGSADNGTADWVSTNPDLVWQGRVGGDGFHSVFDPLAGTLTTGSWFAERQNGILHRSTTGASGIFSQLTVPWTADRPDWSAPLQLDVLHCTTSACRNLVFGAAHLYASPDSAGTWTRAGTPDLTKGAGSIDSLAMAPSDPRAVVVGTTDGNVQWSPNVFTGSSCTQAVANTSSFSCLANASATWTNLTAANAVLPNRYIAAVAFDPTTINTLYAGAAGFGSETPATPGHVFRAVKSGATWAWTNKSGNLPDIPVESMLVNPLNSNQVFVGTDFGFFYTDNVGAASPLWYRYPYGLPNALIQYLALDRGPSSSPLSSTTISAFTHGRGMYSIRLPGSNGFPPHPIPPTMRALRNGNGVDVSWNSIACPNVNQNAYWGSLGDFSMVTGAACHIGNTGSASALPIPAGSWWIIAGTDDGSLVSSFGTDSTGSPRGLSSWAGLCPESAQNTTNLCP